MKRKRIIRRTLAGVVILFIAAAVGGYFYLKSNSFQRFALRQIIDRANTATGGKTEIASLDFELRTLTAHLYNITLRGTESADQPPLLHADELTVRLRIISAIHRQVALREVLLDHPVVHIRVDRDGQNNLPAAPPGQGGSSTSLFDLAIEHARLTNGEVDYNDRTIPLEADLYDLGTDIHFEPLAKRYSGELSYKNGRLHYAEYTPLAHNLTLKFSATSDHLDLNPVNLQVASSTVTLHAQLQNYSQPTAQGDYQVRLHTPDFTELSPPSKPAGDIMLSGKIRYQPLGTQPTLRDVLAEGQFASDVLSAVVSGKRVEARRLQGTYRLFDGNLTVGDIRLEALGGRIAATAAIKRLDAAPECDVQASLSGISLKDLQRAAGRQQLPGATLSGTIRGRVQAGWKGSINNLRARSDLFVEASASSRSNPTADVPVNGTIHAIYDSPRQIVELNDTVIQIPSATLSAHGTISDHSSLQLKLGANNLHQLVALASTFVADQTPFPSISGSATVNATVRGSIQKPAIIAQVDAQNLEIEGSAWKDAKIALHATPSGIAIDSASLINAHRGQATLTANVGLKNWSYESSNPIKAHIEVERMSILDLLQLARQHYPISGDLSASVKIEGSQLHPSGSGSAQIANAHAYGEPIQTLSAKFHTDNDAIVTTLTVAAPAGTVDANLSYTPKTKAYKAQIEAPALVLQKLQTVQEKNLGINGTLSASLSGEGTTDDPQLVASLRLPQLQIQQNTISDFDAELHVTQHTADVSLESRVAQAAIHARGKVSLSGDFQTEANIDTGTIPLGPLVAAYASGAPDGLQGQAELHATVKGPLKDTSKIEAHISIPTLKATYRSLEIGISQPVRADYADSVVTLQPAELRGTGTSLRAQGRIPIRGTSPPTFTAQGSVDVRILQIFAPALQSSGVLALDVRSSGSAINGQLQLQNVTLTTADAPIGVSNLNGTVDISNDHAQISKMTAEMGGGSVSLGGSITYRPSMRFNLALQGSSIRLRYPEGLRSLLDANLAFTGTMQASTLSGRVLLDSLSFTPDFDLSKFADQFSTGGGLSQPGFADTIKLAISAQSQQSLNAVSSQVSIAGQMALQVGGTAANPVITGRTTLTSGELFYRNVRYQLQRGLITFDNPNETHPVLNVSVTTTVEQYNLTLTMRGPLDKLTASYVSDPPLATADIINLVARGQTTEEQAASSQSTDSMVASEAASQLSSSVQRLAGISSLQIDPTLGGNSNPSARIAIQQRVTKNLLFSFSTDVSQPGSEIVQGEYQINKRWSVSVQRDQLGGVAVDGRYHKQF
jgi:translocation and assembly module TamB